MQMRNGGSFPFASTTRDHQKKLCEFSQSQRGGNGYYKSTGMPHK